MTILSRRGLLATTGAVSLAGVLAACADTGADGKAVASSTASEAAYDKAINSGPVAPADVVAASPWAAAVKQANKLVTGGTKTSEVFSWEDSKTKKISGFDAAIAQALARYIIGGDDARSLLEVQQVTSETRETVLTNGTVKAVIATYTITPERAKKIDFAGPYYASSQAILVKADNQDITGVDTLTGDVAVQSNSSSAAALKKYAPKATAKPFDTQAKCVAAVESGQVKAYVVDQSLLKSEVLSNDKVKIVGETFAEDPYGIGLPKDSGAQAFVNTFLKTIEADGTWKRIWDATIGTSLGGTAPQPPAIGSVPGSSTAGADGAQQTAAPEGGSAPASEQAGDKTPQNS